MAMAGASLAVLNCWLVELCRRKRGAAVPGMRSLWREDDSCRLSVGLGVCTCLQVLSCLFLQGNYRNYSGDFPLSDSLEGRKGKNN